jgi:hypothetical protein
VITHNYYQYAYGDFDVVFFKDGDTFYARGIVYLRAVHSVASLNTHRLWKLLARGRSNDGILAALEDLWNVLESDLSKDMKIRGSVSPLKLLYLPH